MRKTGETSDQLAGETTTCTGYGVVVALDQTFDADGNRLALAATVQGTADLKDTFGYSNLDELTGETRQGQTGGNPPLPASCPMPPRWRARGGGPTADVAANRRHTRWASS